MCEARPRCACTRPSSWECPALVDGWHASVNFAPGSLPLSGRQLQGLQRLQGRSAPLLKGRAALGLPGAPPASSQTDAEQALIASYTAAQQPSCSIWPVTLGAELPGLPVQAGQRSLILRDAVTTRQGFTWEQVCPAGRQSLYSVLQGKGKRTCSPASGCCGWLQQTACHTWAGPPAQRTAAPPAPQLPPPTPPHCQASMRHAYGLFHCQPEAAIDDCSSGKIHIGMLG